MGLAGYRRQWDCGENWKPHLNRKHLQQWLKKGFRDMPVKLMASLSRTKRSR